MPVVFHGSVPDLFESGRDVNVTGTLEGDVVRRDVDDDEVPEQVHRAGLTVGRKWLTSAVRPSSSASASRSTPLIVGTSRRSGRQQRLADSARNALIACFGSTRRRLRACSSHALVAHDFSFVYVRQHTSRDLTTIYCVTAFWGGQEGSLLLWLLVLTGYGALVVILNRKLLRDLIVWVVPVIGAIATFFSFILVAVASPFETQTPPLDGLGLVPSLQNPYMVAHPPMLYLGYVGLSVPFAFAAAR